MAVSDATYNKTASYVSSNAYYGYIPPNPKSQQLQLEMNVGGFRAGIGKRFLTVSQDTVDGINHDTCGAMETDDDGEVNPITYECRFSSDDGTTGFGGLFPLDSPRHCLNRKRNNAGDIVSGGLSRSKKLREGGGNGCGYGGSGSTKVCGSGSVRYRSPPERLIVGQDSDQLEPLAVLRIRHEAVGMHALPGNRDHNGSLTNGSSRLSASDFEYERMLLETHGCSVYHLHHQQLQNGSAEAEF